MTDAQMLFHLGEEVEKYVAEYHALDLRRYKLVRQKQSPSYATEIGLVWKAGVDLDERLSVFKETLTTFRESQADTLHTIERNYFTCLYAFFGTTIAACATLIDLTRGEYELEKDPSALTTEQLHVLIDYHQMTSVALQKVRKVFDKYTNSLAVTMSLDELVVNSDSEGDARTQIDASYFVSPGFAAKQWLGKMDEPASASELRAVLPTELWSVSGLEREGDDDTIEDAPQVFNELTHDENEVVDESRQKGNKSEEDEPARPNRLQEFIDERNDILSSVVLPELQEFCSLYGFAYEDILTARHLPTLSKDSEKLLHDFFVRFNNEKPKYATYHDMVVEYTVSWLGELDYELFQPAHKLNEINIKLAKNTKRGFAFVERIYAFAGYCTISALLYFIVTSFFNIQGYIGSVVALGVLIALLFLPNLSEYIYTRNSAKKSQASDKEFSRLVQAIRSSISGLG